MNWLNSVVNRLDSLALEAEPDLSRRRLLTSLALNLVTLVSISAVGWGARYLLDSNGLAMAVVIGYAVVYGTVVYLVYRYLQRRRAAADAP